MKTWGTGIRGDAIFIILFAISVVLAGALGGVFNFINGWISLALAMHWGGTSNVWWAMTIEQGVNEGLVAGTIPSVLFVIGLMVISRRRCQFELGLRLLLGVFAAISLSWTFSGTALLWWALKNNDSPFYSSPVVGFSDRMGHILYSAWVGGSDCGACVGSILSVGVALALFCAQWKRRLLTSNAESEQPVRELLWRH